MRFLFVDYLVSLRVFSDSGKHRFLICFSSLVRAARRYKEKRELVRGGGLLASRVPPDKLHYRQSKIITLSSSMAQIAVWRGLESPQIGYWHHGVLLPDGSVIHYSGVFRGKRNARVRRTTTEQFSRGRPVYAVIQDSLPEREVVARAESRLGESGYNILFNNCETFASWCVTGRDVSRQSFGVVRGVREGIRSEGGWVGGVVGGVLAGLLLQGSIRNEVRRIA